MGSKTMRVKGAGSQSFPAPGHTAPQCGSGNDFHRGRNWPTGVGSGVRTATKPPEWTYIKEYMRVAAGVAAFFTEMEAFYGRRKCE
ncbi:hypothetical protein [Desulfitobacterium hafniense]|uniref:hypothetical protein n=1 Tax=Desulfitobacterium hafniense TaxID=49338 RepID=UPI00059DC009|nr:hypothetical protein [Desulfitobacterium hafniense]